MLKIDCFRLMLLATLASFVNTSKVDYKNYSVFRVNPETEEQLKKLVQLHSDTKWELDFWKIPSFIGNSVDVMVKPEFKASLKDFLEKNSIPYEIMIPDVGQKIQLSKSQSIDSKYILNETSRAELIPGQNYFRRYQRYNEITARIKSLEKLDPRVKVEEYGKSFEFRNLYLVKVSNDHSGKKPVILIDAGHHAREWISHSTLMYLLESLVGKDLPRLTSKDCQTAGCRKAVATKTSLDLEHFDFWFVPAVNPDGYEFSHTTARLWRKTRSQNPGGLKLPLCAGVDPNRNYDFHWLESGSSDFKCSEIYGGTLPFSEPETRALAAVMAESKSRIRMYISLHSYSQLILTPYGYARKMPEDYHDLEKVASAGAEGMSKLRNLKYTFGPSAITLYPAAGGADDYTYGKLGIKYSFTIELPDTGKNGFILPPQEIIPVGHETLLCIRAMTDTVLKNEPELSGRKKGK